MGYAYKGGRCPLSLPGGHVLPHTEQNVLNDEASRRLHFAVASCKLSDGLMVPLEKLGGRNEQQGDYLIPCIALPAEKE